MTQQNNVRGKKNYKNKRNDNNKPEKATKRPYNPNRTIQTNNKYTCEYKMSSGMAYEILKNTSGDPQKILCDWVNQNCGLLWECVKVITD